MKLKKALCYSTAALMAFSSMAVAGHAEESSRLKLLTAPTSEACGKQGMANYYTSGKIFYPRQGENGNVFRIGEDEIAKWNEAGEFVHTDFESEVDLTGRDFWGSAYDVGYALYAKEDSEGNPTEGIVLHTDEENKKFTEAYTLGSGWYRTNGDGYSVEFITSDKEYTLNVYDPSGNKKTKTYKIGEDGDFEWWVNNNPSAAYLGYILIAEELDFDDDSDSYQYVLDPITRDGSAGLASKFTRPKDLKALMYLNGLSENGVLFQSGPMVRTEIYSEEDNKLYVETYENRSETNRIGKIYNGKVVIGNSETNVYKLARLKDGEIEYISDTYKDMKTNDGKIYIVKTQDDKYGFTDENGKLLATFDDVGSFEGDFAPVIKDGKAYLVDRNMNKASEEIDAKKVMSLSDGLFLVNYGENDERFVTYRNDGSYKPDEIVVTTQPETAVTTQPETAPSENKGGNPPTGVTVAIIPIAAASLSAAAIIAITRKKK